MEIRDREAAASETLVEDSVQGPPAEWASGHLEMGEQEAELARGLAPRNEPSARTSSVS